MEKKLTMEQFMELNIEDFKTERKFEPKFLGMKKEDIHRIEYGNDYIEGYDKDNNLVYFESEDDYWSRTRYDKNGNKISYENSRGKWTKRKYNKRGQLIYYKDNNGEWVKWEYDKNGEFFSREASNGNKTKIINGKTFKYEGGHFFYDGVEMFKK